MSQSPFTAASLAKFARIGFTAALSPECLLCGDECSYDNWDLCSRCQHYLRFSGERCSQCALPLTASLTSTAPTICGDCQLHPKPFGRVHAACIYNATSSHLIYSFKEGHQWQPARALCRLLIEQIEGNKQQLTNCTLVPVPCHTSKLRERGFAQASELSRYLSRKLSLPHQALLTKNDQGPPQKSLNREQRLKNLSRTFSAAGQVPEHCLLIDDVMTTGATAIAATNALINAGAKRVDIAVLARTPLKAH